MSQLQRARWEAAPFNEPADSRSSVCNAHCLLQPQLLPPRQRHLPGMYTATPLPLREASEAAALMAFWMASLSSAHEDV